MPANNSWIENAADVIQLPDLNGKIAIVTGASDGIGKATASHLLQNGVSVWGLSINKSSTVHPNLKEIPCDLADTSAIERAFALIGAEVSQIDYVVNVAGIDPKYSLNEMKAEEWDALFNVNLRAYYFVIQAALPLLRAGIGKSIVNVSSINYRLGLPGRAAYSSSKAGILGLTSGLSRELGREQIRVNTVSPGWVFTERQIAEYFQGSDSAKHLKYLAEKQSVTIKVSPEDIANHIIFYLSNLSRASAGHNCVVDGGWLLE